MRAAARTERVALRRDRQALHQDNAGGGGAGVIPTRPQRGRATMASPTRSAPPARGRRGEAAATRRTAQASAVGRVRAYWKPERRLNASPACSQRSGKIASAWLARPGRRGGRGVIARAAGGGGGGGGGRAGRGGAGG